jgi:hypothetical protein
MMGRSRSGMMNLKTLHLNGLFCTTSAAVGANPACEIVEKVKFE